MWDQNTNTETIPPANLRISRGESFSLPNGSTIEFTEIYNDGITELNAARFIFISSSGRKTLLTLYSSVESSDPQKTTARMGDYVLELKDLDCEKQESTIAIRPAAGHMLSEKDS